MNGGGGRCGRCGHCDEVRRRLWSLLDGECDVEEARALRMHIATCPECTECVGSEEALRRLLRRCCRQEAPVELRRRISARIRVTYLRGA